LTLVKPEKNACLASALFQCSLIRSDAAAEHKATPPPPMKNARRAAAAGHKTTQRRRRPPVCRRTALICMKLYLKIIIEVTSIEVLPWMICFL